MSEEERDRQALMMGPLGANRGKEMGSQSNAPLSTRDQALPILSYCAASIMMTVVNKVSRSSDIALPCSRGEDAGITRQRADFSVCRVWRALYHDFSPARDPVCGLCHCRLGREANGRYYM
jgi:hypothetical protein